ncbi:MAG TPA: sigma-70 family RNA polymerase sigma factor, partial [Acidimicrobiales bacterium]|nr:sigma-70 family RNA polymerase sigma factor [Acidimicrobiales bacterium]
MAQQALSRAWHQARAYDSRRSSVSTWVLRMTRNLALDTLRRNAAEPVDPPTVIFLDQSARGPDPDESASIADHTKLVRVALRQIPVEERRALVLATLHGYTAQDISHAEAIPLGTAKARMRSGLIKMRALLREE